MLDLRRVPRRLAVASIGGSFIALCTLVARMMRADPMVGFELVGAVLIAAWIVLTCWPTASSTSSAPPTGTR